MELDSMKPTNPYSASKASAEHFIDVFFKSYNFPSIVVRMCNVYGPQQSLDKLVPKFIRLADQGKPFTIHGNGKQTRCFLHVSDACSAIYAVLTKGKIGEVYNIGSMQEISVIDIAKEIKKSVDAFRGKPDSETATVEVVHTQDRPYNDRRYHMDGSKLKSDLGWKESVPFKVGLNDTVSWYLNNQTAQADRERFMIYGAHGWIGSQFVDLLEKEGVEYVVDEKRLGDDPDEVIKQEILSVAPTHIASFIGRTHGPGHRTVDYLEGGPDKLAINLRDNLFGPLLLAEICRKFNIHLTYMGSGCLFTYSRRPPCRWEAIHRRRQAEFLWQPILSCERIH